MRSSLLAFAGFLLFACTAANAAQVQYYNLPKLSRPHDVALSADGAVWFTAERLGQLVRFDPKTGKTAGVSLGGDSSPRGVIAGPDGTMWVADSGQNAIVRVDPKTHAARRWDIPKAKGFAALNGVALDGRGRVWFTGQNGFYGRLDPKTGDMKVWNAPRGRGPDGIAVTKDGTVWFASVAGSYLARVNPDTGAATVIDPPEKQAAVLHRVAADSKGRLWVSEWAAGKLAMYDPSTKKWSEWAPPVKDPQVYAVYVDADGKVWISEWTSDSVMRFDPATKKFESFKSDKPFSNIRNFAGRKGEIWGGQYDLDRLMVVRY